jgi:mannan endo-1,4-beta-mannosidase
MAINMRKRGNFHKRNNSSKRGRKEKVMKNMWKMVCFTLLSVFFMYGCAKDDNSVPESKEEAPATPSPVVTGAADDTTNASGEAAAVTTEVTEITETIADPNYDTNFELLVEAEDASFTGNVRVESSKKGFTGTGYATGFENDSDTITFTVTVQGEGAYDLNFRSVGNTGHKENYVFVDGSNIGVAIVDGDEFTDSIMEKVYLTAGEHQIQMTKFWGWILLDSLKITASAPADMTIFDVKSDLVDQQASDRTKRLYQYLKDMYGKKIISGQYSDGGMDGYEFTAINNATGKYPALLGLDFIDYTPSRVAFGAIGKSVEKAIKFDQQGGMVTFCWHWNAPEKYLVNNSTQPWWKGFYKEATNIDLKKIMNGEDSEGYDLLVSDIDAIAVQLKKLQDANIPILWRPLHEASGGWFWWGTAGPEAYNKLYQLVFDRLVNYHGIHNLIWVWNGQSKDWYPGDAYVDIVGTDIYPGEKVYTSQITKFGELVDWNGDSKKIVALTENGCLFDPDLAVRDTAMWSFFATWQGEFMVRDKTFTLNNKYNDEDMIKKVFTSDKVITLDELPDLKTYGN